MYTRRRHWYFAMMGICIALFVLAWGVVRLWSVPVAVGMCVVAMVIPPVAAIVANRRGPDDVWWDEPDDNWLKDEPKDDTWQRDERAAMERARSGRRHPDDGGGPDSGGAGSGTGK
ncbi:DUF3099 domain-containing protein [Streptantibioticus parmotrematis]|uniref:DUF3099 domain-containing protein n=1 Tax=Streptantibioticus parmotrematis TaxID=2873249 RepID=UPI003F4D1D35